jgi:hypothetical protein
LSDESSTDTAAKRATRQVRCATVRKGRRHGNPVYEGNRIVRQLELMNPHAIVYARLADRAWNRDVDSDAAPQAGHAV